MLVVTLVIIILLFASLVLFHEWGHFIVARRGGVEADEFGIGFPPRLFGRKIGKTLYSINLLPLGGFVRLKGEDSSDMSPGSFAAAKFSTQAKILLAGVVMNLIAAVIMLYILCLTGLPALGSQFEPSFLKSTYAQPKQLMLLGVDPGSPAAKAGLKERDTVVSANGQVIADDGAFRSFTQSHAGQTVTLGIVEDGKDKQVTVKLRAPGSTNGYLGVETQQVYKLRYDPLRALVAAGYVTITIALATLAGLGSLLIHIPDLVVGLFHRGVPAAAEATGGPIYIVYILQHLTKLGWPYVLIIMANVSVALAVFNVLPLPALDGGRLFVLAVQKVTRKKWSADAEARYHAIGFLALITLMVVISVYDVRKIGLGG